MFNNINNVIYKRGSVYDEDGKTTSYMLQRWVSMYDATNAIILNRSLNPNYSQLTDEEFFRLMFIATPSKKYKKIKYIKKGEKSKRKKPKDDEINLGEIFEDSASKIKQLISEIKME